MTRADYTRKFTATLAIEIPDDIDSYIKMCKAQDDLMDEYNSSHIGEAAILQVNNDGESTFDSFKREGINTDDELVVLVAHSPSKYDLAVILGRTNSVTLKRALRELIRESDAINFGDYYAPPPVATKLKGTPFYSGCLQLVFAPSKFGKSVSVAKVLGNAGHKAIWLDKDYNVDADFISYLQAKHIHVNNNVEDLAKKLLLEDGTGKILVFDSLKDFAKGGRLDTNEDSQMAMEYIRKFVSCGYTAIVIAHATREFKDGKLVRTKIKGNQDTIESKCDLTFELRQEERGRILRPLQPRISGASMKDFVITDVEMLGKKVAEKISELMLIDENIWVSYRDVEKSVSSELRSILPSFEGKIYEKRLAGKRNTKVEIRLMSSDLRGLRAVDVQGSKVALGSEVYKAPASTAPFINSRVSSTVVNTVVNSVFIFNHESAMDEGSTDER